MSNAVVTVDQYAAQVIPANIRDNFFSSMPSHIKPVVFERNLMNALMANPALMNYPPALIYREVAKAAGLGLLLDPLLGEAYIVPAYNYKTSKVEPQLRVGYKGTIKLVRQSDNVTTVYAHEVHQLDRVEADLGFPKVFKHKPVLFGERGPIIGYVACIGFKDGTFDFEPMSVEQCQAIRDRSDAWKAFVEKKIKSTPWQTDESEMSKKTVLNRLMKRQEKSAEVAHALAVDNSEFSDIEQIPRAAVPRISQVSGQQTAPETARIEHRDPPAHPAENAAQETKQAAPQADGKPHLMQMRQRESFKDWGTRFVAALGTSKTLADVEAWENVNQPVLDDLYASDSKMWDDWIAVEIKKAETAIEAAPQSERKEADAAKPADDAPAKDAKAKAAKGGKGKKTDKADPISSGPQSDATPAGAIQNRPDIAKNYDAFIVWATAQMDEVTAETLEAFWNEQIEPIRSEIMPPDFSDLQSIYRRNENRVSP